MKTLNYQHVVRLATMFNEFSNEKHNYYQTGINNSVVFANYNNRTGNVVVSDSKDCTVITELKLSDCFCEESILKAIKEIDFYLSN